MSNKIKKFTKTGEEFNNANVTRGELIEIIKQLGENMDDIQRNLVESVNVMYREHVFPAQLELVALENLLIDKGIFTMDEFNNQKEKEKQRILDKAKQVKEDENGKLKVLSKEEEEENEKKAIVKANIAASKTEKDKS